MRNIWVFLAKKPFFLFDRWGRNRCCKRHRRQNSETFHQYKSRHHKQINERREYTTKGTTVKETRQWIFNPGNRWRECSHLAQRPRAKKKERFTEPFSVSSQMHSFTGRKRAGSEDHHLKESVRINSYIAERGREINSSEKRRKEKECWTFKYAHEAHKE